MIFDVEQNFRVDVIGVSWRGSRVCHKPRTAVDGELDLGVAFCRLVVVVPLNTSAMTVGSQRNMKTFAGRHHECTPSAIKPAEKQRLKRLGGRR